MIFVLASQSNSDIAHQAHLQQVKEGWQRFISKKMECHQIEGDHYTLLQGASASEIERLIRNDATLSVDG